jgi:hypothetical protein
MPHKKTYQAPTLQTLSSLTKKQPRNHWVPDCRKDKGSQMMKRNWKYSARSMEGTN